MIPIIIFRQFDELDIDRTLYPQYIIDVYIPFPRISLAIFPVHNVFVLSDSRDNHCQFDLINNITCISVSTIH